MKEKEFIVYFEIFNKKMKTTVLATNQESAKQKIINQLIFHKVQPKVPTNLDNDIFNDLMNIFGL